MNFEFVGVRQVGLVGVRAKASEGLELGMWGQRCESATGRTCGSASHTGKDVRVRVARVVN